MGADDKTTRHKLPQRVSKLGPPWLVVIAGSKAGHKLLLDRPELVVGKEPGVDLVLGDTGVSRRHFKIVRASDGIFNLVDLNSTNGVYVNGARVDLTVLREHDRVALGPEAVLLFTYDGASARLPAPAPAPLPLSARQLEVARLVCEGLTNAGVAEALGISPRTVTSHLEHIYDRLDIGSRAELARILAKRGLV